MPNGSLITTVRAGHLWATIAVNSTRREKGTDCHKQKYPSASLQSWTAHLREERLMKGVGNIPSKVQLMWYYKLVNTKLLTQFPKQNQK